jgi:aspartate aminotransferase-like enzyme
LEPNLRIHGPTAIPPERLGYLGSVTTDDVLGAISALEATAVDFGLAVQPGTAVAAAQQALVAAQEA